VSTPEKALAKRIRELRRRHFGARGKGEFARQLGLPVEEYERFERGMVPPGELMVRMCESTGEDLQWLLTGVAARGTVVISGARNRHQNLLTRIAQALDGRPELAAPLEAFVDLLLSGEQARKSAVRRLPAPQADELIPLFEAGCWPDELPDPDGPGGVFSLAVTPAEHALASCERAPARLAEPAAEYDEAQTRPVSLVVVGDAGDAPRRFVHSGELSRCFPGAFGLLLGNDEMSPMFAAGDAVLVSSGAVPAVGRPAVCKLADGDDRCRIWLGEDGDRVQLGRVSDGSREELPRERLRWALEVLYRVAPAA